MNAATAGFLQGLVDPDTVFTGLSATTAEDALTEMAQRLTRAGVVDDAEELARRLVERERLGCTALGGGIAIPHIKRKDVDDIVLAIGSFDPGVDFHAPDGLPVRILFLILSPARSPGLHLQTLARISRLLKTPGLADALRAAKTSEEIVSALHAAEASPAQAAGKGSVP